jgi:hypothetical protein
MILLKCLLHSVVVVAALVVQPGSAALAQTASSPADAASAPTSPAAAPLSVELPSRPSDMLVAPIEVWRPVLRTLSEYLDERQRGVSSLTISEQVELHIHRALVFQSQQDWGAALQSIAQARALQTNESGRHLAGLLNELLARQAQLGGSAASLRHLTRERVLAMPWNQVEPGLLALREQLVAMEADAVKRYVAARMDLSADVSKRKVSLGFALQLLAVRFQLQQVIPQRSALLVGLDDALRVRSGGR